MLQIQFYKDFSEEDFINDEYFQDWVLKSGDERAEHFWKNFQEAFPGKKDALQQARKVLLSISFEDEVRESAPSEERMKDSFRRVSAILGLGQKQGRKARVMPISQKWWYAAASVILLLAAAWFFMPLKEQNRADSVAPSEIKDGNEIAPGGNRATLTLADGSVIVLDSVQNGMLSQQGGTKVIKLDSGQLAYDNEENGSAGVFYNTIMTPRGGQYQLTLEDGTKVWLNAESSLRYPTAFTGKERKVELKGEGYFEVAHDAAKPFIVATEEVNIRVLGTHFNVNAYADEDYTKTTLLQGSVVVAAKNKSVILKPGQQAVLQPAADQLTVLKNIDTEQVVAWKNGYFSFQDASLKDVMQQIARWYNVDIQYEGTTPERRFRGGISRSSDINEVLKILEKSRVHFKVDGRTILVTQ